MFSVGRNGAWTHKIRCLGLEVNAAIYRDVVFKAEAIRAEEKSHESLFGNFRRPYQSKRAVATVRVNFFGVPIFRRFWTKKGGYSREIIALSRLTLPSGMVQS